MPGSTDEEAHDGAEVILALGDCVLGDFLALGVACKLVMRACGVGWVRGKGGGRGGGEARAQTYQTP